MIPVAEDAALRKVIVRFTIPSPGGCFGHVPATALVGPVGHAEGRRRPVRRVPGRRFSYQSQLGVRAHGVVKAAVGKARHAGVDPVVPAAKRLAALSWTQ